MSEVVPLPSFGEVFFDARGQERCLRVTWHEGTLVLSLWRGEMCTASFRMPMEDVGRLLDTLDEGFAEATGEQPAVPAEDPRTGAIPETGAIPGTGQYHRPPQQPPADERPTAALSPNDVLVARGAPPAHQDKLVASYGETTAPRETTPAYGERNPFTGPQYVDTTGPQQKYTGDPFSGPQYTGDPLSGPQYTGDPLSGPQYTGDPLSGPQYIQPAEPFTGPQYVENEPVYQMPGGEQRRPSPLSTDPLGFPSQAAAPYPSSQPQYQSDPQQYQSDQPQYQSDPAYQQPDPYARRHDTYQQPAPQPHQPQPAQSTAGLGTPMHG
ncbi:hypothetical protein ITP53_17630, partial [Nonomuraea sp. K274]|nr:hypothetical protein [Nonomuraea cypriaca]